MHKPDEPELAAIKLERKVIAGLPVGFPALNRERALDIYRRMQSLAEERDDLRERLERLELGL